MPLEQLLEKQITDLNNKIRTLSYEKEALIKNNADMKKELEGLLGDIEMAKKKKKTLDDVFADAKKKADDYQAKVNADLEAKQAEISEQRKSLESDKSSFLKDRQDHAQNVSVLEENKKALLVYLMNFKTGIIKELDGKIQEIQGS